MVSDKQSTEGVDQCLLKEKMPSAAASESNIR